MIELQQDLTAASMLYLFKIACSTHKTSVIAAALNRVQLLLLFLPRRKLLGFLEVYYDD